MKKALFLLSMLCVANSYASIPLPNGKGHILPLDPTGPMNEGNSLPAIVKLDTLNPNALYDVVCHVSKGESDATPIFVRFDILGLDMTGEYQNLTIDGKVNYSHQYKLPDQANHVVTFHQVRTGTGTFPGQPSAYVKMTRLDGWMIPFDYDCQVDFVVGKNK